jgi:hypothetical protein
MRPELTLYTRKDCCLCEEMKEVIRRVAARVPLHLKEIDVDSDPELRERLGSEVPLLCIAGRKAFKYSVTERDLQRRLSRQYGLAATLARKVLGR